jgi:hypothetical protein
MYGQADFFRVVLDTTRWGAPPCAPTVDPSLKKSMENGTLRIEYINLVSLMKLTSMLSMLK